jgi:cytoskeletal protein CcmA (bactofilin family)
VIAVGTIVRGDVTGGDSVEVRGTLEGDCRIEGLCVVAQGARVLGNIEAAGVVVAGEVEAGTVAAERIELRASARVRAAITTRVMGIADGAFYEGDVQMLGPDAPAGPVLFRDRRKTTAAGPPPGDAGPVR